MVPKQTIFPVSYFLRIINVFLGKRKMVNCFIMEKNLRRFGNRWYRAILLPLLFLVPHLVAEAVDSQVTVGTAEGTTQYFPVSKNRDYIHSEIVYTSDVLSELGDGVITSLSFCGYGDMALTADYELYLTMTDLQTAPDKPSDVSLMTKVFEGQVTSVKRDKTDHGEIIRFEFGTPFTYEAGRNLLVTVVSKNPSTDSGDIYFDYQKVSGACGFNYIEGNSFYTGGSWTNMRLQIQLGFEGSSDHNQTVTIGSASATHNYVPFGTGYKYGVCDVIYKAEDLGIETGSLIKSLAYTGFSYADGPLERHVEVFMQNTSDTLEGDAITQGDVTTMTKVFDGEVTLNPGGEYNSYIELLRIALDTPFKYEGDNVRVVVKSNSEKTDSYFSFADDGNYLGWALYGVDDSEFPSELTRYYYGIPVTTFTCSAPEEDPEPVLEPMFTITTAKEPGSWFGFTVWTDVDPDAAGGLEDPAGGIYYDMGDGKLVQRPFCGQLSINDETKGDVIKIYRCNTDVAIEYFSCYDNEVTSIDIKEPKLRTLALSDNQLESIDLSACPDLERLALDGNKFVKFEYDNPNLKYLSLRKNSLEQILISGCTALEYIDVGVNQLRAPSWIEFPDAQSLKYLDFSYNNLYSFNTAAYTELETLLCNSNRFAALDLSKNKKLKVVSANYQGLANVNVTPCPLLESLNLAGTQIEELNLTKNPALVSLDVTNTLLSELDTEANTALTTLKVGKCQLSALNVSANTNLTHLEYPSNKIESIDLSNNKLLSYLDCSNNGIKSLDLTGMNALDTLMCSHNSLTDLDIRMAKALTYLDCASNSLDKLDINSNNALVNVNCSDNLLSSLSVADMTELIALNVSSNSMNSDALGRLFEELPDINGITIGEDEMSWKGILNFKNNPGSKDVNTEVLVSKGWKFDYVQDILGDASAMLVLPEHMIMSRYTFSIMTGDEKVYVDWGNGVKEEYITDTYPGAYTNPTGVVEGKVIKIYAPAATLLAVSNTGLEAISTQNMPELDYLSCTGNSIVELDVSDNTKITHLDCAKNPLTNLVLPENNILVSLDCSNTLLRKVDFSKMPNIEELLVSENRLTSLDLSSSSKLRYLRASFNELESIDLSNSPDLEELYLGYNNLTELDLSNNKAIKQVSVSHNKLRTFDATPLVVAEYIQVPWNEITDLRLDNPLCVELLAGNNKLSDIDLTKVPSVTSIELTVNNLASLDLSANNRLKQVFVTGNRIADVKFPEQPLGNLGLFSAGDNQISALDFSKMPNVSELVLSRNKLSGSVDLSALGSLSYLNLSTNAIEKLTLANSAPLSAVYVQYNKLSTLIVPSSSCVVVDATRNNLSSVNVSACTQLMALFLDFNRLSTLNISGMKNLVGLSIRGNNLGTRTLNDIYAQLPDITGYVVEPENASWMTYLNISGNPGAADSDQDVARDKGWIVVDGETLPVLRNITVKVSDAYSGLPIDNASFKLKLEGETFALTPTSSENGVYSFIDFEVFVGLEYNILVECDGYVSQTVVAEGLDEGDVSLDVKLVSDSGVRDVDFDNTFLIYGGQGSITVRSASPVDVMVYDLSGRMVASVTADGMEVIDGIAPGIYIVNGRKVAVR